MLGWVVQTADVTDPIGRNGRTQPRDHSIWNEAFVIETTVIQRIQTGILGQVMLLDR